MNFVRAGFYDCIGGQPINIGLFGQYWSSLAKNASYAHNFGSSASGFATQDGSAKGIGFSVRRVTKI